MDVPKISKIKFIINDGISGIRLGSDHRRPLPLATGPRRCRDLALHGRTGYGGTCAGASAPIFTEPSYLEPKIRSGNAAWSAERFAKFFVKRAPLRPSSYCGTSLVTPAAGTLAEL